LQYTEYAHILKTPERKVGGMADQEKRQPAAVYVAWGTFKNAIEGLAQALPNRIDKTVYPGLNPAVVNQLLTAFKFLGLTDDAGKPTQALDALAVKDESVRKHELGVIVRQRYSELFSLDLVKTTPLELQERMEKAYGVTGDTREKAIRFFLNAITYLGVHVSPLLKKATSNGAGAPRKKRTSKTKAQPPARVDSTRHPDESGGGSSRIITLKSGGTLTLSASLNFLALSPSDRKFFSDLIDRLDEYERGAETE
jgi:hypothetical protein